MKKKISFVHSPQVYYEQNHGTRFTPVWAYTLATHVPEDWELSIYDTTVLDHSEIAQADVYALSGINQDFPAVKATHDYLRAKYPAAKFILGGPMCWSFEKDGKLADLAFFDHLFILDGEETLPDFLRKLAADLSLPKLVRAPRYDLGKAKPMRFDLFEPWASRYYGGVVEVSRGCPFLCEFCDIRVLPDNNEAHNKDVRLIVQELDHYHRLGVRQIQMACDNFIGDLVWARECVDAVLEWQQRTGAQMALYTWATVNIARVPDLMTRMRQAGFTTLFIGVESFNKNSILETAKVQNNNDRRQLIDALRTIQSYGFIVAPGLIFGFDSDPSSMFDDMLEGVAESCLIAGDPTFLIALPGTPLYDRMKRTGRLIAADHDSALTLHKERVSKVQSNIRYLQDKDFLVKGFMDFISTFISPEYMYRRFRNHVVSMMDSDRFVPVHSVGYGSLPEYLKFQFSSRNNLNMLARRITALLKPGTLWCILKAFGLVVRHWHRNKALKNHFTFWLFVWTNLLVKYDGLREEDFKIQSVGKEFHLDRLWAELEYEEPGLTPGGRNADNIKVAEQLRSTKGALKRLKETLLR